MQTSSIVCTLQRRPTTCLKNKTGHHPSHKQPFTPRFPSMNLTRKSVHAPRTKTNFSHSSSLITPTFQLVCLKLRFFSVNVVADLAVGLINVSTDIAWKITVAWHAGNVLCKIIRFLQAVVTYASTYVLVALSIDRYDAITHPMNFSGSCKYGILCHLL